MSERDYGDAIQSIFETVAKSIRPLQAAQKSILAEAIAVWMDKVVTERVAAERKRCDAELIEFGVWWSRDSERAVREDCGDHALREWREHRAQAIKQESKK